MYLNSSALEVIWEHPICDYGVRRRYTVTHDPLPAPLDPPGVQGFPRTPHNLSAGGHTATGLTPNTNYSITGCGHLSHIVNQTDEDAPQAVSNSVITSLRNSNSNNNTVTVRITWTPPSLRNGSFNYMLMYPADFYQLSLTLVMYSAFSAEGKVVSGQQQEYIFQNGLPYADNHMTIYAFNIKLGLKGPSEMITHRSLAIGPTAVTNLTAATSSQSIRVLWDLPLYPNGPILFYKLFYRASNTQQQPPNIRSDGYLEILVMNTEFEVTGLIAYTNYTLHVLAIGQGNLFRSIDTEILQQTNSTIWNTIHSLELKNLPSIPSTSTFHLHFKCRQALWCKFVALCKKMLMLLMTNFMVNLVTASKRKPSCLHYLEGFESST